MDQKTLLKKLGAAVRQKREELGYSQDSFADAIAMHRAYYSSIERGERNLTMETLARVAEGLETKISHLLVESGL